MTDIWKQGLDEHGTLCEYNMLTGDVRYTIDKAVGVDSTLTQEEIDALVSDMSDPHIIPNDFTREFDPPERETCPDCKGTGEYHGILVVENCKRCKGIGQI